MYVFHTVPLKKAIKPGTSTSVKAPENCTPADLATLETLRADVSVFMDRVREAFEKNNLKAVAGTEPLREDLVKTALTKVDAYVSHLFALVTTHHEVGVMFFYFWGSSVTERMNHAFDDYRYETLNIYFNVAVLYHTLAAYVLQQPAGAPVTEGMEKEAYAFLCYAAAYMQLALQLATEVAATPIGVSRNAMIEDSKPAFLECMVNMFLADAQIIGMVKAARNELNKNKEIVPKLTHRAFQLSQRAAEIANKQLNSSSPAFRDMLVFLKVRASVLDALVHAQTAPCRFDASPGEALWFSHRAGELAAEVQRLKPRGDENRRVTEWAHAQGKVIDGIVDRIRQINSLVTREKAADGPFTLPAAQELARPKLVTFPRPLPASAAPPPPPLAT